LPQSDTIAKKAIASLSSLVFSDLGVALDRSYSLLAKVLFKTSELYFIRMACDFFINAVSKKLGQSNVGIKNQLMLYISN